MDLSIRRRLFRCLRVELCSNTSRIRSLISRRLVGSCVHVAYVFRTPNLYHFIPLVSRLAPHRFHQAVANRLRNLPREAPDPYRTYYRLNSRGAITRAATRTGLHARELRMVEKEPSYGMASKVLFLAFMLYERAVNSSELLAGLRVNIFGVLERPHDS